MDSKKIESPSEGYLIGYVPSPQTPRRRKKKRRTEISPEYWVIGKGYRPGIAVDYNGDLYSCLEPHISEAGHTPDIEPLLWEDIS